MEKQNLDETIVFEKEIKNELFDLLKYIKFEKMAFDYMIRKIGELLHWVVLYIIIRRIFLVPIGYIFTSLQELSNIIVECSKTTNVKVTNCNGKTLIGKISLYDPSLKVIQSLQGKTSEFSGYFCCWRTNCESPPLENSIKKSNNVKWCLYYTPTGSIGVGPSNIFNNVCYIIAYMTTENDFKLTPDCKIDIF